MPSRIFPALIVVLGLLDTARLQALPVINEIMFHPAGAPEDRGLEWIELYNPDPAPANLAGWKFTQGVSFTFPNGVTIPAGGYLIVAANAIRFATKYPGVTAPLVGGWSGQLSNSGEALRLENTLGEIVDEVNYADEGDWALRARGPLTFNHKGWIWICSADGTDRTFELRQPGLDNDCGQNWGVSSALGGSPGAQNSLAAANVAPLIKKVKHRPEIPRSTDPITISCQLEDELLSPTATLNWRLDGAAWQSVPMSDPDGDGDLEAVISPQANLAVVEFYVSASDGIRSRSWPAQARTSDIGAPTETFGQVTNALLQVDNSFDSAMNFTLPGNQPLYRLIMIEAERSELRQIGTVAGHQFSDAEMNGTFISHDGTGLKTRYLCGFRNRGFSSALGPPNNYNVSFPHDARWNDRPSMQLNCRFGYSQALGAALFTRAGVATQETSVVQVRVNGADLALTTGTMYGRYARNESLNADWVEQHFPNDPDGNLYRLDDHAPNPLSGEFLYEGETSASYSDTFLRQTNNDDPDWSDLINLCRIISAPATGGSSAQPAIPNDQYIAAVSTVFDIDQFFRFIATDALIGNQEGGLQSGRADDCSIYRGVIDRRFRWVPHDLDDVFDIGNEAGNPIARSIFSYDSSGSGLLGLRRLFNHPQLVPRYYATLLAQMDDWFNSATIDPIIDQIMVGWVPATGDGIPPARSIDEIKAYVTSRRANVLGQIQQNYSLSATSDDPNTTEGYVRTTTGAITLSGTFNVARTYSVTVNGRLAQWFYRTSGANSAGTWKYSIPSGGGGVLRPGLNRIVARFWDQPDGTGNVLRELTNEIFYNATATTVSGTLAAPEPVSMIAPSGFLTGVPISVRIDLHDAEGRLDRLAWNRTATLSANNGVTLSPSTIDLYNGMGSALVNVSAATLPSSFTLTAIVDGRSVSKNITNLNGTPPTNVSGTLPTGLTTWNGVIRIISDVIVPAGGTLDISPGTFIIAEGTPVAGSTTGATLIVNGTLNASGTATDPVQITCAGSAARWGQVYLDNAQPSTLRYTLLSRAGHAPGEGHTGRGPMLRLANSTLTLEDSVLSDGPAKAMYSTGTCDIVIRRSLITRMITGPELSDGAALLVEDSNIQQILPDYRESNSPAPDDEDCLYVHNTAGRPVVIRRSVLARCGDDLFDCLGGPITVEDSILREGWDKGMSLLNNDLNIARTLIIDCDKAIVPKSNSATTRSINVDRCTIVCDDHDTSQSPWGYAVPPSSPDPDTPSTGLYTQNKSGQSDPGAILAIAATNSIIVAKLPVLIDAPYSAANTILSYTSTHDLDTPDALPWPGIGNIEANPLFAGASGDYRLQASSPCRDTGNPSQTDPDGSRVDMGALPFTPALPPGAIVWTPANGPYRVTGDVTVPIGVALVIQAGTNVQFEQNRRMTVRGNLQVLGTPGQRVVFSHVPGTTAVGDADPIKNGVQTGPPKWGGIRIVDSMNQENVVRHATFINAQGTDPLTSENWGSLGFIRSWGLVEYCTWAGTHLRMCYGRNAKITVRRCTFPSMFLFDPELGREENPTDFLPSCDNQQEPLKVEYPTIDPEITSNAAFVNGMPAGGWFRVYYNDFFGNRGHNDVFDADSGRWGQPGQFLLDCRYNHFHGLSGDEHIDLGGDAYIASNIFEHAAKDEWTSDTGYSNAISSGDRGTATTIMVARNLFFDLDHAINLKANTGTLFEHNTVANFHPDFTYSNGAFTQNVKCSAVNVFIPEDGFSPTLGDGGYLGFNLISNVPRLVSGADTRKVGGNLVNDITTKLEFGGNLVDQIADTAIGPNHPGGIFNPAYGSNTQGAPGFVNPILKDYSLRLDSSARHAAPGGLDYGATVPEWAYILGGPATITTATNATFTIGGPGLVAYKWRLDGGAWSAPIQLGAGGVFPRTGSTVRQATLNLTSLSAGTHELEVLGQDMAGNWQDADPARTIEGLPQALPTSRTWMVDPALVRVVISEISANNGVDWVELHNAGANSVTLNGWTISDSPLSPAGFAIPNGTTIPAGGYFVLSLTGGPGLDKDGDAVGLYNGITLVDSINFGQQAAGYTIGRTGLSAEWTLCSPTQNAANTAVRLGDPSGVRINEWFASNEVVYDYDWIELVNPGTLPVDISGLKLTDSRAGQPRTHVIAPLSFIGPGGVALFIADGDTDQGSNHLPFSLDAEQGSLGLYAANGTAVDSVAYFPQTSDVSTGRNPSGSGTGFFDLPTAGLSISITDPVYVNALAILRGLRITELMYNGISGSDYDWVELRNVGSTAFNVGGVQFINGIDFTFPSLVMNPGDQVVVVKNLARFQARYGDNPVVAGVYSGQLDNAGERLTLRLPPPFDGNILDFEYDDAWLASTDGLGAALLVFDPTLRPAFWDERDTWVVSELGGTPSGFNARTDTYSGWSAFYGAVTTLDDRDTDGVPALVEYALGMDPRSPNGDDGRAGTPFGLPGANGAAALQFLVPQNAGATQSHGLAEAQYRIQASSDLSNWTTIATKTPTTSWTGTGAVTVGIASGGYLPVTVEDTLPITGQPKRFLRLQITWVP